MAEKEPNRQKEVTDSQRNVFLTAMQQERCRRRQLRPFIHI